MTRCFAWPRAGLAIGLLVAGALVGPTALAQGPGAGPPGGRGGPRFGGFRQDSAADVPLAALDAGLNLTADQKSQIGKLQQQFQQQRQEAFPHPGGQAGAPPDPAARRAAMDKFRTLEQDTTQKIDAILTSDQKAKLPPLLKEVESLRATGIPAEMYGDLKLTADQKQKLAAIAQKAQDDMQAAFQKARDSGDFSSVRDAMQQNRQQAHESALKVLTADQSKAVEQYRKDHPEAGPGFGFRPPRNAR